MSDKDENENVARLVRLNDELTKSLERCRTLLHDYEVRLTANSNEKPDEGEETREA